MKGVEHVSVLLELLLLTMLNLTLLCTIKNRGCKGCTIVRIEAEPLSVHVVHGWMRARTLVGPTPLGGSLLLWGALFERSRQTSDLF